MTSYQPSATLPTAQSRKKKPDWGEFYKNGVPKEIIVIDDDDDVNDETLQPTWKTVSRAPAPGTATALTNGTAVPPANKKRRTGMETAFDLAYYDRPTYSIPSQQYGEESSGNSISTDRTTSLQTTAPTSLGSHGSASTNNMYYEEAAVGQKRKRVVTRKSARDEQKRRELEIAGDAYSSYIPPPKPPIKAKDVAVPVIRDVS
jgi:dual-specificity kinase